jgi:predicted RecB family nuclease
MPTRYEISEVPPQGGYIAKQCPVIAHNRNDPTIEVEPLPVSDATQLMFDRGIAFEEEVFAQLVELHSEAVAVDRSQLRVDREAVTATAMDAGAILIIGGRLPADPGGRRVGEPDVLVRHNLRLDGSWSYVPVDVKHHLTLDEAPDDAADSVSDLDRPWLADARPAAGLTVRSNEGDALQLAHYLRMLEACGHAPDEALGGIIGKELVVVWYDLDEAQWLSGGRRRTTMERYDFEFDFRLDIISVALSRGNHSDVDPLVVPVKIADCDDCEWWGLCGPVLEESDDVSLLPRIGWPQWRDLRAGGITSQEMLARLDWPTAWLIQQGVDLRTYLENAPTVDPETPVLDVIGRRRIKQASVLAKAGFHTATDVERIDQVTVDVAYARGDKPISSLAAQIDMARARIGSAPVYRKRGVGTVVVPRADVEVDIDMENSVDGSAYLWGALITDGAADPVYRSFVSWEPTDSDGRVSQRVFGEFWDWLDELIASTEAEGRTVAVYCYSRQAEERHMRLGIAADDTIRSQAVEELIVSERWVDMRSVFESQLITGDRVGLKVVADLAGFAWRDDDPGGAQSMVWYEQAVNGDQEARERLLAYNEDDVRATKALRDWMETPGHPSIADQA